MYVCVCAEANIFLEYFCVKHFLVLHLLQSYLVIKFTSFGESETSVYGDILLLLIRIIDHINTCKYEDSNRLFFLISFFEGRIIQKNNGFML